MTKKKHTTQQELALLEGPCLTETRPIISNRARKRFSGGFTLTELAITMVSSIILLCTVGVILVHGHTGWNKMYNRVYSDVVTEGYVARKTFNAVVRKSSTKLLDIGNTGEFIRLYYYNDFNSTRLDRYARFYTFSGELWVDYGVVSISGGSMSPSNILKTVILAHNVQSVNFSVNGDSVQMILELDNGREALTITCSAVRHNM